MASTHPAKGTQGSYSRGSGSTHAPKGEKSNNPLMSTSTHPAKGTQGATRSGSRGTNMQKGGK